MTTIYMIIDLIKALVILLVYSIMMLNLYFFSQIKLDRISRTTFRTLFIVVLLKTLSTIYFLTFGINHVDFKDYIRGMLMATQNFIVFTIGMYYTKQMKHALMKRFYNMHNMDSQYLEEKKTVFLASSIFFVMLFFDHVLMGLVQCL